jgi:hypothetical protein
MKLSAVVAIAALTLVGAVAAEAQPDTRSGPVYGYQPSPPPTPPLSGSAFHAPRGVEPPTGAGVRAARVAFLQACEPDRRALCGDRTSREASTRCILRQRAQLSSSCGQALNTMADLENVPLGRP